MRKIILAAGLTLFVVTPVLAWQPAPGPTTVGGGEPLLVKSVEPDLSTDPNSIDELRHRMDKGKRKKGENPDQARPAQASDIAVGKTVHDLSGVAIALVERIEGNEAVLRSGTALVKVPVEGFGINKKGLLLNLTKPQFDAAVAASGVTAPRS